MDDTGKAQVLALLERFWNDVAGLPWRDKTWTGNDALKKQSKQHFIGATYDDIMLVANQTALTEYVPSEDKTPLENAVGVLDALMVTKPSRALADAANRVQELLNEESANATSTSKDD